MARHCRGRVLRAINFKRRMRFLMATSLAIANRGPPNYPRSTRQTSRGGNAMNKSSTTAISSASTVFPARLRLVRAWETVPYTQESLSCCAYPLHLFHRMTGCCTLNARVQLPDDLRCKKDSKKGGRIVEPWSQLSFFVVPRCVFLPARKNIPGKRSTQSYEL